MVSPQVRTTKKPPEEVEPDKPPVAPEDALEGKDSPPEHTPLTAEEVGEGREAWCAAGHPWVAEKKKGPVPKWCPEHHPAKSTSVRGPRSTSNKLKQLEDKITDVLALPAIPMTMAGDMWPANHVTEHARGVARAIVNQAKDHPLLLNRLLTLLEASGPAELVFAVLGYAVPVGIYYGVIPAGPLLHRQLRVPYRDEQQAAFRAQMEFEFAQMGGENGGAGAEPSNITDFPTPTDEGPEAA